MRSRKCHVVAVVLDAQWLRPQTRVTGVTVVISCVGMCPTVVVVSVFV